MSEISSQKRKEFLGIPYGTAQARLKKILMFDLVQRLGDDICYRCGRRIAEMADFSVDHNDWGHRSRKKRIGRVVYGGGLENR